MNDPRPIGLFDSGVGGLTVLREVWRRLPGESTIYVGDSARTPYGTRHESEVIAFSEEIADYLVARGAKAIVIACNTASAVALQSLRRRHPTVPILGVVRPGATAAALATRTGHIGVLATKATVQSGAYFAAIKEESPAAVIEEHAASELVPLIESGELDSPRLDAAIADLLAPLRAGSGGWRIDTLLLGCTHFPLIRAAIARGLGESVAVVDAAAAAAAGLADLVAVNRLDAPGSTRGTAADAGRLGHEAPAQVAVTPTREIFTTGDALAVTALAARLFRSDELVAAHLDLSALRHP